MQFSNIMVNHQISAKILDIIKDSKDYCFIVSPYFQPWKQLLKVLELAASEEKRVIFLFRDDQKDNQDILKLNWDFDFDIFFISNLHAKMYLNETDILISSMNLYDYSKENNFEVAYIAKNAFESKEIVKNIIIGEMIKIWESGHLEGRHFNSIDDDLVTQKRKEKKSIQKTAFCIRCKEEIKLDLNKPYCKECYERWNYYQNYDYEEKVCHRCGKEECTTMRKPLCRECFYKINNIKVV